MRLILTAMLMLFAGPVLAQSAIVEWNGRGTTISSIEVITCDVCAPVRQEEIAPLVSTFEDGMSREVREVNGETMVFRTDNMMGGSPVTTVTGAELVFGSDFGSGAAIAETGESRPGIDLDATTAALDDDFAGAKDFELRLN